MDTNWLIPLVGGVAAAVGLFLSRPERPRWALATLALLLVTAGWQSASEYSAAKTTEALQLRAHRNLAIATNRLLGLLAEMVAESTDDWVPTTDAEFFSPRLVETICPNLNLDAPALVTPIQPWWRHAGWLAGSARDTYREVLGSAGPYLDAEVVDAVSRVEASYLMWHLTAHVDLDHGSLPNTLCAGVEDEVSKALPDLRRLHELLRERETLDGITVSEPWAVLKVPNYLRRKGRSRVSSVPSGAG